MCVSFAKADFRGTTVLLNEVTRSPNGLVHVLGYQNTVVNYSDRPNAMLIHVPSNALMTPRNLFDTRSCTYILDDMVKALEPPVARSLGAGTRGGIFAPKGLVQVFDHDIYTVVMAQFAEDIPGVLGLVREDRRPDLNVPIANFYGRACPGYTFMLFCFNNRDARRAAPVVMWYNPLPLRDGRFGLPGIDCHTGGVPDMTDKVGVDHWLIVGSDRMQGGEWVNYRDEIPQDIRPYLPERVMGLHLEMKMRNGDFGWRQDDLYRGQIVGDTITRILPPGLA
jgi:hypothetical protein